MFRFLFTVALVALVAPVGPAFGQTPLAGVAARVWAVPLVESAESTLISLEPASDDPRDSYAIHRHYSADSFVEEWDTAHATTTLTFRADGRLVSEHHQNSLRQTTLDVTVDRARGSVHTVITEKGKLKSDKTTPLDPGIALREELDHLVVQAWRAGIRDGITCKSLSPDGGMVGDFRIVFQTVSDPMGLSNKYAYPAEFRAAFAHGPYVVADMSLQGIASLFFPHHFYLVYSAQPQGLVFAGYFGEDPKTPIFQFTP